jgi:hypothetical protein
MRATAIEKHELRGDIRRRSSTDIPVPKFDNNAIKGSHWVFGANGLPFLRAKSEVSSLESHEIMVPEKLDRGRPSMNLPDRGEKLAVEKPRTWGTGNPNRRNSRLVLTTRDELMMKRQPQFEDTEADDIADILGVPALQPWLAFPGCGPAEIDPFAKTPEPTPPPTPVLGNGVKYTSWLSSAAEMMSSRTVWFPARTPRGDHFEGQEDPEDFGGTWRTSRWKQSVFMKVAEVKDGAKKKRMQKKIAAVQAFGGFSSDKLKRLSMGRKREDVEQAPSSVSEHSDYSTGMRFQDGVMVLKV